MSSNTLGHRLRPALQTGLTAAGSSQATAFPLTNNTLHEFTTVAASTGAVLPIGVIPSEVSIFNDGVSLLTIYPPTGGSIDSGSANASVSLAAGSGVTFWASTPSNWYYLTTPGTSEGGGTPGGSNGEIQFDNDGTFGGTTNFGYDTTNSCPIWTPQSDPATPAAGDLWFSTSSLAPMFYRAAGLGGPISQRIFKCGACSPVSNVSGNTFAMAGATEVVGSLTIPANTLVQGSVLRWVLAAQYSCTASSPEIVSSVLLNSVTIISSALPATLTVAATNQQVFNGAARIAILSAGSSATASGVDALNFVQPDTATVGTQLSTGGMSPVSSVGFDGTVAQFFDFQVGWSAANPDNSFQVLSFSLYLE
jgi:hypothetical protein